MFLMFNVFKLCLMHSRFFFIVTTLRVPLTFTHTSHNCDEDRVCIYVCGRVSEVVVISLVGGWFVAG